MSCTNFPDFEKVGCLTLWIMYW